MICFWKEFIHLLSIFRFSICTYYWHFVKCVILLSPKRFYYDITPRAKGDCRKRKYRHQMIELGVASSCWGAMYQYCIAVPMKFFPLEIVLRIVECKPLLLPCVCSNNYISWHQKLDEKLYSLNVVHWKRCSCVTTRFTEEIYVTIQFIQFSWRLDM